MQIDKQTIRDAADKYALDKTEPDRYKVVSDFEAGVAMALSIRESLAGPAAGLAELERLDHLARGYDAAHDDKETEQQLAIASALYMADGTGLRIVGSAEAWPWPDGSYPDRRGDMDRIRQLIIAAGLALAEADRLIRIRDKESGATKQ